MPGSGLGKSLRTRGRVLPSIEPEGSGDKENSTSPAFKTKALRSIILRGRLRGRFTYPPPRPPVFSSSEEKRKRRMAGPLVLQVPRSEGSMPALCARFVVFFFVCFFNLPAMLVGTETSCNVCSRGMISWESETQNCGPSLTGNPRVRQFRYEQFGVAGSKPSETATHPRDGRKGPTRRLLFESSVDN